MQTPRAFCRNEAFRLRNKKIPLKTTRFPAISHTCLIHHHGVKSPTSTKKHRQMYAMGEALGRRARQHRRYDRAFILYPAQNVARFTDHTHGYIYNIYNDPREVSRVQGVAQKRGTVVYCSVHYEAPSQREGGAGGATAAKVAMPRPACKTSIVMD